MMNFTIELDDALLDHLRRQARIHGVTIEAEARRILAEGAREGALDRMDEIRARQKPHQTSAVDLIREDRDR